MKNRILALVLVVALVAVGIAGATMAYFTDEESVVNVATIGNVSIKMHEYQRAENVAHDAGASGKGNGVKLGALVPYVQGQPLFPAYAEDGTAYTAEEDDLFFWGDYVYSGTAGNGLWDDTKLHGAMDKFIFVENTGASACYFRTWIAFECPEGMEFSEGSDKHFMNNVSGSDLYEWVDTDPIVIDGVRYIVTCAIYQRALEPGQQSHPSLLQVVMTHNVKNEDAAKLGDTYEILAFTQAVQVNNFPDAETALIAAFGEVKVENTPWDASFNLVDTNNADSNESFKDALNSTADTVVVNLTDDVTYDVAAMENNSMGVTDYTKNIIINGNGHTITFNHTNSDWNNIVTANGAKLYINDAHITNTGKNNGPWNRHDLNFACDVVLNNVTSDKALAFKAGAQLTNVEIKDANTSDTYAIWIQPKGQTITLDNVTIDMIGCTDGRGIKIDNQYLNMAEEGKVTLIVKDTTFKTEEKSAILVNTTKGADITLINVDITGVVADTTNAVWVDEAASAYVNLVNVTGGNMIEEP